MKTAIYIISIILMVVLLFGMTIRRNRRQERQAKELMDSLQVGDKVGTHIGIFGRIKKIYETTYGKMAILEIGTNEKINIEIDMRYIAGKDEKTLVAPSETKEKEDEKSQAKEEKENNADKNKK